MTEERKSSIIEYNDSAMIDNIVSDSNVQVSTNVSTNTMSSSNNSPVTNAIVSSDVKETLDNQEITKTTISTLASENFKKPLLLPIDHKLSIRKRRMLDTFEPNSSSTSTIIYNSKISPLLEKATTESKSMNNKLMKNDNSQSLLIMYINQTFTMMSESNRQLFISGFMAIFIIVVQLYTWITLPIYFLWQKPWVKRAKDVKNRVRIFKPCLDDKTTITIDEDDSISPIYERIDSGIYNHEMFNYNTLADMFNKILTINDPNRNSLGFRQVLSEEVSLDDQGQIRRIDGRQLKQYQLTDYKWLSYAQVVSISNNLAQGLMATGIKKNARILIISETRIEWMLCFQAILKTGATMITVFSNLGVDGVACGIEETTVENVIISLECVTLLKSALERSKHSIKQIIYIDGIHKNDLDFGDNIKVSSLSAIENLGKQIIKNAEAKPYPKIEVDDLLLIMYTSGTTGMPKSALLTQRQFIGSMKALFVLVRDVMHEAPLHTYISYLPMAHVLELTLEVFFFLGGVRLGYASPFTLTDSAPGLGPDQKPDIKLLKPTIMVTVPLVLDRIIKEINDKLRARTPISQPVFQFLMDYKSKWTKLGYQCNIVRNLLCQKVREQLGNNLKYIICGGAPLNANTQATIKSVLDVTLIQGYGTTETTGAVFCMDFDNLQYGNVGAPLGQVKFRLQNWIEGGYSIKDKPNPRGEILIGGDIVSLGYFKRPKLVDEAFFTDSNGIRWFRTGDIGEMYSNGTLKIIDRCKDLIKLQNGEYISLGKVEAALKISHLVDNVCAYANTFSNDIVALISPNKKALNELVLKLNKNMTLKEICNDYQIHQIILEDLINVTKVSLSKKEIPRRIKLVPEEWSPDNGLLTAAMKLKRRAVEEMYKQELYELYNDKNLKVIPANGYDQNNNKTLSVPDSRTS